MISHYKGLQAICLAICQEYTHTHMLRLVNTFRPAAHDGHDLKAHGNALLKSGAARSNEQATEVQSESGRWLQLYGCLWQVSDDEY